MTSTILVRLAAAASPIIDAGRELGPSEHALPETPAAPLATVEANAAADSSVKPPEENGNAQAPLATVEANAAVGSSVKPPEKDADTNGDKSESEAAKEEDLVEASVSDESNVDCLTLFKRPAAAIATPPVTPKRRRPAKTP